MEERIQTFLDLNVWKKAHQLVLNIYKITADFPSQEHSLADQLKRTSSAVAAAICEGFQKRNKQDKVRLYNDAQSALNDVYYLLLLTRDLKYYDTTVFMENAHEIQKMISGLVRSVMGLAKSVGFKSSDHSEVQQFTPSLSSEVDENELL
ncbi:MAG: ribosomal protein [Bacteroidota bacterium]|nr:ribosomal protein [Bacteroidota bacterium]